LEKHPALEGVDVETMRVVSLCGRNSAKDVFQPYFSKKAMNFDGNENTGRFQHHIGVMCQRGFKPNMPNQDDFVVFGGQEWCLFGVFDGHGPSGHNISHFVQEMLPKQILEGVIKKNQEWEKTLTDAFKVVTEQLETEIQEQAYNSGTTTSVGLLSRDTGGEGPMRLRCGHVGDSSVVYAKKSATAKNWEVTLLTDPHKPDRDDEAARIDRTGGKIQLSEDGSPSRLLCGSYDLAMSRSMGDFHATPHGLVSVPEMSKEVSLEECDEHMILACSDGIWDVIPPQQAVQIATKFRPDEAQKAAEKLVQKAQVRWQEMVGDCVDDITVILIRPNFTPLSDAENEDPGSREEIERRSKFQMDI